MQRVPEHRCNNPKDYNGPTIAIWARGAAAAASLPRMPLPVAAKAAGSEKGAGSAVFQAAPSMLLDARGGAQSPRRTPHVRPGREAGPGGANNNNNNNNNPTAICCCGDVTENYGSTPAGEVHGNVSTLL